MRVKIGTDPFTGRDLTVESESLRFFNHVGCPICAKVLAEAGANHPDDTLPLTEEVGFNLR